MSNVLHQLTRLVMQK